MGGGSEQWGESGGVWFVEIDFGRFLSKYQCLGKWRTGVGGYRFIYFWERFRKSIIPKCYLCCSEKTGFCDFWLMRYLTQCLFGGGSSEGEWCVVEIVCGRFLSKYQCWVKRGAGVGRIPFFRGSERVLVQKVLCFERMWFCLWFPCERLFLREVGARWKRRRAVCRNWILEISTEVSVLGEESSRSARVSFYLKWGKVPI